MKKYRNFTLIEIMVVIAVFVLMMAMLLEFLAGAQRVWGGTRGKGDTFLESKAGMDFVVSLLDGVVVNTDFKGTGGDFRASYFNVTDSNPGDGTDYADRLRFFTRSTALGDGGVSLYWVEIFPVAYTDSDGLICEELRLKYGRIYAQYDAAAGTEEVMIGFRKDDGTYTSVSAPWVDAYMDVESYWNDSYDPALDSDFDSARADIREEMILERVTSFYMLTGNPDSGSVDWARENTDRFPSVLMLNIGMMTPDDYAVYQALDPSDRAAFKNEKEMTFSRMIYFDQAEARGRGQI